MIKLKNCLHTIIHIVMWIFWTIITLTGADPSYYARYGGALLGTFLGHELYLFILVIYLISGIFFDIVIYHYNRTRKKNLVIAIRVTFIVIMFIFSLLLLWATFVVKNWTGQM